MSGLSTLAYAVRFLLYAVILYMMRPDAELWEEFSAMPLIFSLALVSGVLDLVFVLKRLR